MSTQNLYLGIDPGKSGGIVGLLYEANKKGYGTSIYKMPKTLREMWGLLSQFKAHYATTYAVIEKVGGYIGTRQGYSGNPATGSSMFNFGENFGALKMALTAAEIPFEEVRPQEWQAAFDIRPRIRHGKFKESAHDFKKRLKFKAQELYPKEKLTLNTCDAMLLATYAYRDKNKLLRPKL